MTATTPKTKAQKAVRDIPPETPEKLAAFNAYLAMGDKRSVRSLAKQLRKSPSTLTKWSIAYNWSARVAALQQEATKAAEEESKKQFFADVKNVTTFKYEILDALKARADLSRACAECGSKRIDIADLIRILQVVKTELGEPTSITKGTVDVERENPFADLFSKFFPSQNANAEPAGGRQVP